MNFGKRVTKQINVKKAWIIKITPRPEVKNLFGVLPISYYMMRVCRTKYYEYKKLGLQVYKENIIDDHYYWYYVRVYPWRNKVDEKQFRCKENLPIRFTFTSLKNGKDAKLYFDKEDIGECSK